MLSIDKSLSPTNIRLALRNWVQEKFELSEQDVLIDELGFVNKAPNSTIDNSFRADLALANGRLVGFEIKSEKDTLKRWSTQMIAYTNVFDEVWLCTHGKHLPAALELTPKHIGIILVDDFESLAVVRSSKALQLNNIYDLSGLLWKDELLALAKENNINVKSRTTKNEMREMFSKYLNLEQVRTYTLRCLKKRKSL